GGGWFPDVGRGRAGARRRGGGTGAGPDRMPGGVRRDRLVPVAGLLRLSVRALGDVPGIEPGRFRGGGGLAAARPPRRLGTGRRLSPRGRDQFPFAMSVRAAVRTLLETGLGWSGGAAPRRAALARRP